MRPRNRKSLGLVYGFGFILLITASISIHFDSDSTRPSVVHSVVVSVVELLHRLMTESGADLREGLHAVVTQGISRKTRAKPPGHRTGRERKNAPSIGKRQTPQFAGNLQDRKDLRLRMASFRKSLRF